MVLLMIVSYATCAQDEDKNIVIENKSQLFTFSKSRGNNAVEIQEQAVLQYRCDEVRRSVLFSEMYNENEEITDIDIRVNDKKAKGIDPAYEYYAVENIFYSDARVCYFHLPLEKKGSHSSVTFTKTYKDPRYFTSVYFTEEYSTESRTITFSVPRWMKVEIKEYNFDGYDIKKTSVYDSKSDADVITYTARNLPPFRRESAAPGISYIYPHLLVMCKNADVNGNTITYFNTLADQYKWYRQLVSEIGNNNVVIEQKARELTNGLSSDVEKIKAIYNWVQHNIRYIAFEDGIAGFKPARADAVLNKKYGDCKGMANLVCSLLKSLGYDARLCWIGTNHIAYDYSTPSMAVDNHMICALFFGGKKYFLDATETNIGFGEYAERIQGRQVLIENGESYLLEKIPAVMPEQNTQLEKGILNVDASGNLKGTVNIVYKGESRSSLLSRIQATKKDNVMTALTNYLSENNSQYQLGELKTSALEGADSTLTINYNVLYKGGASTFDKELYVEPDFRKEMDGITIEDKRKSDVMLPFRMNVITEESITIPAGYKVSQLPADKQWSHPNIFVSVSYKQKGDKIEYKKQLRIPDIMLKKKSFSEWNRIIKELGNQYREQIILEKK